MLLKEIKNTEGQYTDKDAIYDWLDYVDLKGKYIKVNDDLTVDVYKDVVLTGANLSSIPIQFNEVHGCFLCTRNKLTSLRGCPKEVYGDFSANNNQLQNINFLPNYIGGYCGLELNPLLTSFHNIHHYAKVIDDYIFFDKELVTSHMLGLLYIKHVDMTVNPDDPEYILIINKYLLREHRDVHACQEELLDAGFPQIAKF